MSDRASLLNSEWKILVDGVEVPHQGFSVQFQKNAPSTATIVLEPDQALVNLRPQSVVSIWTRERFVEDDNEYQAPRDVLLNRYYLYWEGLLSGTNYEKSPQSRSFKLICESLFGVWTRTQAFMTGIGPLHKSSLQTGSLQLNPDGISGLDAFSLNQLVDKIDKEPEEVSFSDRIISTITYLSALNGNLRLQVSRYRLLNRISGISDNIYKQLLGPFAAGILGDSATTLPDTATVYNIINKLQAYGFYSNVHIPIPNSIPLESPETLPSLSKNEAYAFTADFKRNEFLVIPETYFTMPPPCNLVFPEMIRDLSVTRMFYNEPTRTIVSDPFLANRGYIFYLAPSSLLNSVRDKDRSNLDSREVFGLVLAAVADEVTQSVDSPYVSPVGARSINTLSVNTGLELEKGIVTAAESYMFETTSAFARSLDQGDDEASIYQAYSSFMTSIIEYRHKLAQYDRRLQVNLNGHRYLVPGFSTAIFDSDISYLASVETLLFSVDPLGAESTSVVCTKARPIAPLSYSRLESLIPEVNKIIDEANAEIARRVGDIVSLATIDSVLGLPTATPITQTRLDQQTKAVRFVVETEAAFKIQAILAELKDELDIPIPPTFVNPDLFDSEKLDQIYSDILGCKPLYTSAYNTAPPLSTQSGFFRLISDNSYPELLALYSYIEGVTTLNNVFNMFPPSDTSTQRQTVRSWQEVTSATNTLGIEPYEWAHRTFLKRRKIYLREYIDDYDLLFTQFTSDGPSPTQFVVLVSPEVAGGADWDNSIFSKLVIEGDDDPVIEDLRRSAPDYLKPGERRRIVLDYSRKHFGAQAFDGS